MIANKEIIGMTKTFTNNNHISLIVGSRRFYRYSLIEIATINFLFGTSLRGCSDWYVTWRRPSARRTSAALLFGTKIVDSNACQANFRLRHIRCFYYRSGRIGLVHWFSTASSITSAHSASKLWPSILQLIHLWVVIMDKGIKYHHVNNNAAIILYCEAMSWRLLTMTKFRSGSNRTYVLPTWL